MKKAFMLLSLAIIMMTAPSCATPPQDKKQAEIQERLTDIDALVAARQYTDAITKCIDLSRVDPFTPGLAERQAKILTKMSQERSRTAAVKRGASELRMDLDVARRKVLPDTYGLRLSNSAKIDPLRTPKTPMELALAKKVTIHLEGVNLDDFIMAVGASEGINIIADAMGNEATMTVHAEDVPLVEILDYVSRNLGVSFYVGDSIIWATKSQQPPQTGAPLETRMYGLRKGISADEINNERINIIEAIERFIPATTGADLLFDKKAHVLLVKNTRDNLARIEDIIEKLDVCPPQVLIEARFIGTSVSDLRELGIDWVLKSPLVDSEQMVPDGTGGNTIQPRTQIDTDSTVNFVAFPNAAQGLNLTYQGLLTGPMFEAVLHALDISGKATTLSVPKVTTVNNRTAMIRVGEDFRYFDQFDIQSVPTSVTDSGSQVYSSILVPVGSPQLEELGIQLQVVPSVGGDMSSINLSLSPTISEFVRYETYQVATGNANINNNNNNVVTNGNETSVLKIPIFRTSSIETEVVVQSGETVVMGGLVTASESRETHSVPILSSIPLVGKLFRRKDVQEIRQNLLIFVTATILSERGEDLVPVITTEVSRAPGSEGGN